MSHKSILPLTDFLYLLNECKRIFTTLTQQVALEVVFMYLSEDTKNLFFGSKLSKNEKIILLVRIMEY